MKNFFKRLLYKLSPPQFRAGYTFSFGFIFHTEQLYSTEVFEKLIAFCVQYKNLTLKKPLCTVMSPVNKRVAAEMQKHDFSVDQFMKRLERLAEVSDIGYHGHFWRTTVDFEDLSGQVRHRNYTETDDREIAIQFMNDYLWLKKTGLCKPYYAAGWWFINPAVVQELWKHTLQTDFSFTRLTWVDNPWAKAFLEGNNIRFGEPFQIQSEQRSVCCIQTVMGCPNTGFPQDFVRILNTYLDTNRQVMGMIATHDYNLTQGDNLNTALRLVSYLASQQTVTFHSATELTGKAHSYLRTIPVAKEESIH